MKISVLVALLLVLTLTAGTATAQQAPFNEVGVTMGHWHIASKDVEANKKLFLAMGGKLYTPGGNPLIMFPGVLINLNLGNEKGEGGTQGSVVNHVGFIVNNVQQRVAQWKAAGVRVLPGNNNRLDQAFVETPDGVRIEILEDKTQSMRSAMNMFIFSCRKMKFPKHKHGMRRPLAANRAPEIMARSWTFREYSSGSTRRTRNRRPREGVCWTTSVLM